MFCVPSLIKCLCSFESLMGTSQMSVFDLEADKKDGRLETQQIK
jgi:hypothetical protein